MEFKLVKEESFESISKYLDIMYEMTDMSNPLAFVSNDDNKYMITKMVNENGADDDLYVICYEENGELKTSGFLYDKDSYGANLGDVSYRIYDDGATAIEDNNSRFKQQLFLTPTLQNNSKKVYVYTQEDPINKRGLYMRYVLENSSNPQYVLPYLNNRTANDILFTRGIIPIKERLILINDYYYKYIRLNNDVVLPLTFINPSHKEDVLDYFQTLGFYREVSDDMINLCTNEKHKVRTLKKVADEYKKNTNI